MSWRYWNKQLRIGAEVQKRLESLGIFPSSILDFGCGEGGVAFSLFHSDYCENVAGYEPSGRGVAFNSGLVPIFKNLVPWKYELILVLDVVEHVQVRMEFWRRIDHFLAEGGKVYLDFPPYLSPFGAHQHCGRNWRFPWSHLIPGVGRRIARQGLDFGAVYRRRVSISSVLREASDRGFAPVVVMSQLVRDRWCRGSIGARWLARVPIVRDLLPGAIIVLRRTP